MNRPRVEGRGTRDEGRGPGVGPRLCAAWLRRALVFIAAATAPFAAVVLEARVQVDPPVPTAVASSEYMVAADGESVFVEKFKDVHIASFAFSGSVKVFINTSWPVKTYSVSPKSAGIEANMDGSAISFTLDKPGDLVVRINGAEKLFIFAGAIDPKAPKLGDTGVTNVLDFGVDPVGQRVDTKRLQEAIDAVAAKKGTLYFPRGEYLTGMLTLKSNLNLYLAPGALIQGSPHTEDYPIDPGFTEPDTRKPLGTWSNLGKDMPYSRLIFVDGATNVRVFGRGVIDGDGKTVRDQGRPPNLVRIRKSSNVTFEDVILRDPACWNTHILASHHVTFRNVKIVNDQTVYNTDGIDPDSSQDVLVENCFFYCADDPIAIKNSDNSRLLENVERITIRGCSFFTLTSAMKLGSESRADYQKDILFENNDVLEAKRAITLSTNDGGRYENIRFINNRVDKLVVPEFQVPILIHVRKRTPTSSVGWIHDVLIKDMSFAEESPKKSRIAGYSEDHDVRNVRFVNLSIAGRVRTSAEDANIEIDKFVSGVTFEKE